MRRHNVFETLFIQGLKLIAELEMIDHRNDLRRHFGGIIGTAYREGTHVPAETLNPCGKARNIGRGIIGSVVDVADTELRTSFVMDDRHLFSSAGVEGCR